MIANARIEPYNPGLHNHSRVGDGVCAWLSRSDECSEHGRAQWSFTGPSGRTYAVCDSHMAKAVRDWGIRRVSHVDATAAKALVRA